MKAAEIATEAARLVSGDRQEAYGDAFTGWSYVARMWSAYLEFEISAEQAATLMELLKIARRRNGYRADNYIDGSAYAAIAGEIAGRETRR